MGIASGPDSGGKYDVCLSFAGEQRDYVDRVATHLEPADLTPEQVADLVVATMRNAATSDNVTYAPKGDTRPNQEHAAPDTQPADRVITSQLFGLAYRTGQTGNYAAACAMLEELLPVRTRILGHDHPHTLRTRYNLAHWTGAAGDRATQRTALALLLADQGRILGSDHPDTKLTQQALADIG